MADQQLTEYLEKLEEAEELAAVITVNKATSTREHSLSFTNLQTAKLWAERDVQVKESRAEAREVTE